MEEWQSVFEEWFPKEISKSYPIKISKQYTSSQRWEIYAKLTKKQRELVDKHRRYLISSRFMEEHYLAATDWVFSDFKINPFFRTKRSQQKLYCECLSRRISIFLKDYGKNTVLSCTKIVG